MSLQYCGRCHTWHKPSDGYYWGPGYDCFPATPPPEAHAELVELLEDRIDELENKVWAIELKLKGTP